ncbi:hypothetical protein QJS10_CPA09g00003 [Acorus calamus]|uniref:Uncharacterized protein n=1 Tax=Acorus calamus TaxID=4465 RepID=A0AAV9E7K1_ACOCL|nr:hypothetical protein QJS10_CPA09g00003 [Acorus calamus]
MVVYTISKMQQIINNGGVMHRPNNPINCSQSPTETGRKDGNFTSKTLSKQFTSSIGL